jgi:hypothetical protein
MTEEIETPDPKAFERFRKLAKKHCQCAEVEDRQAREGTEGSA